MGMAACFGLVAGVAPLLAIALIVGLATLALLLANVTAGVVIFTVVAFLESLPTIPGAPSIAKLVGLFLVAGWLGAVVFRRLDDGQTSSRGFRSSLGYSACS